MDMNQSALIIRDMQLEDIDQVAKIHRRCFSDRVSLFSALHPRLTWHLYAQYVEELESVGKVLADPAAGRIAGFAAGTLRAGFQKRFLRSHFFLVCWYVLLGLVSRPVVWKLLARAIFGSEPFNAYRKNPLQFEKTPPAGPVGYFMPIAIDPDYRGGGNSLRLARALMDYFFDLGVVRIRGNKIDIHNIPSYKLFVEKLGWSCATIENQCYVVWKDRDFDDNEEKGEITQKRVVDSVETEFVFRKMQLTDLPAVGEIHRICFPASLSIYSVLSPQVVQNFYKQFVLEPYSIAAVCVEGKTGRICGYATGTMKPGITGRFLRKNIYLFTKEVLKKILSHKTIIRVIWAHFIEREKSKLNYEEIEGGPPSGPVGIYRAIAVHPDYRGKKLSEKLVLYVTNWLFEQGAVRIRGNGIRSDNIPSVKLFQRLGWNVKQVTDTWMAHWIDRSVNGSIPYSFANGNK